MAISRARKEDLVSQYTDLIHNSQAIFLTEYKGLDVKAMEDLRQKVRDADGSFHVTKNTLFSLALEQVESPVPEDLLEGQVATGFASADIAALAKALVDFADEHETLVLKGGIMDNELLTPEQIESLAKLPSLDELRGQLVGLISAPARNIAATVAGGVRQLVNVIDAYAKSEETADSA